ncbi:MAG: hypothetical protein ABI379_02410 [Rhodanobacter sp.]
MKIEKQLTDNGCRVTGRFTDKRKKPSGEQAFDCECVLLGIDDRLIKLRRPQTKGMVERFNGRISVILATTRFRSRDDLQTTIEPYGKAYRELLPQRALGHKALLRVIRAWREKRPEPFVSKTENQSGLDR